MFEFEGTARAGFLEAVQECVDAILMEEITISEAVLELEEMALDIKYSARVTLYGQNGSDMAGEAYSIRYNVDFDSSDPGVVVIICDDGALG